MCSGFAAVAICVANYILADVFWYSLQISQSYSWDGNNPLAETWVLYMCSGFAAVAICVANYILADVFWYSLQISQSYSWDGNREKFVW